jgi:hypothetical protein
MSPWDGASRAPLRAILGVMMAFDAVLCAIFLGSLHPSAFSHPHAPGWLLGIGANLPALVALAGVAVAASLWFARRPGAWVAGLIALVSVGVLVEAQGALLQGPMRFLFFSGATLLGWLFGLAFARWQKVDVTEGSRRTEALAEQGAVAALAAAYLGALVSKLVHSGLGWVIHGGLQADIAGQHVWGRSGILDALALFVLEHAWLAHLLAAFALLAQASAVLLPYSRRGRMVSGSLLLIFHLGVWLLMPIVFPQAMVLIAAFAFPWPRWFARVRATQKDAAANDVAIAASTPAVARALAVAAAFVAVAWLPSLREFTRYSHFRARAPSQSVTPEMRQVLGDLVEGASVDQFRVDHVGEPAPGVVQLELLRGTYSVTIEVVRHGLRPFRSPKSVDGFDLYYRRDQGEGDAVSDETRRALLDAVALRLRLPDHERVR